MQADRAHGIRAAPNSEIEAYAAFELSFGVLRVAAHVVNVAHGIDPAEPLAQRRPVRVDEREHIGGIARMARHQAQLSID